MRILAKVGMTLLLSISLTASHAQFKAFGRLVSGMVDMAESIGGGIIKGGKVILEDGVAAFGNATGSLVKLREQAVSISGTLTGDRNIDDIPSHFSMSGARKGRSNPLIVSGIGSYSAFSVLSIPLVLFQL